MNAIGIDPEKGQPTRHRNMLALVNPKAVKLAEVLGTRLTHLFNAQAWQSFVLVWFGRLYSHTRFMNTGVVFVAADLFRHRFARRNPAGTSQKRFPPSGRTRAGRARASGAAATAVMSATAATAAAGTARATAR
jgi:hypothetical protein